MWSCACGVQRAGEMLDVEIKRWAAGKEGNLRALLSTLQFVSGPTLVARDTIPALALNPLPFASSCLCTGWALLSSLQFVRGPTLAARDCIPALSIALSPLPLAGCCPCTGCSD